MSRRPHSLHHVNFPTTDPERTRQWYGQVFGLERVGPSDPAKTLRLTNGTFDLHFTPVPKDRFRTLSPLHFAIEVEDWDGFLAHLAALGVRHTRPVFRPQDDATCCYVADPDGHLVALTYHGALHPEG